MVLVKKGGEGMGGFVTILSFSSEDKTQEGGGFDFHFLDADL